MNQAVSPLKTLRFYTMPQPLSICFFFCCIVILFAGFLKSYPVNFKIKAEKGTAAQNAAPFPFAYYLFAMFSVSIIMVMGPSFAAITSMWAPNSPVSTDPMSSLLRISSTKYS